MSGYDQCIVSAIRARVNTNPIDYIHEPADDENPESYILPDPSSTTSCTTR